MPPTCHPAPSNGKPPGPYWHQADQMMRSAIGQRALGDGWGRELYLVTLQHGMPSCGEENLLQLDFAAREHEKFFRRLEREKPSPMRDALLAVWRQERALEDLLKDRYRSPSRGRQPD